VQVGKVTICERVDFHRALETRKLDTALIPLRPRFRGRNLASDQRLDDELERAKMFGVRAERDLL
jgi:hypothetical protein